MPSGTSRLVPVRDLATATINRPPPSLLRPHGHRHQRVSRLSGRSSYPSVRYLLPFPSVHDLVQLDHRHRPVDIATVVPKDGFPHLPVLRLPSPTGMHRIRQRLRRPVPTLLVPPFGARTRVTPHPRAPLEHMRAALRRTSIRACPVYSRLVARGNNRSHASAAMAILRA